ncbi:MAG: peptidyl-prolyl cis-trans isomerase, partial [Nitrospirota bacterium]|nr:peptidyl-prolyl cis-trans isomerase [Nitrospirota bacterium]
LLQEAKRLDITLNKSEITHQMALLMHGMDETRFFQYLSEQKIERAAWEKSTHENLVIEKLLKQLIHENDEKALALSDETLRAYYENNREQWHVGERLKLQQIIVGDEKKAQALRADLMEGADFDKTARLHSIQTQSENGKIPPYLTREELPEAFDALFQNDIGSISKVIKTPFGYHLVMIEDKQAEQILPFQEIEEKLNQTLLNRKRERVYSEWIEKLRRRTEIRINEELLKTFS